MSVILIRVYMEANVWTGTTTTRVSVPRDLMERTVARGRMCVQGTHVETQELASMMFSTTQSVSVTKDSKQVQPPTIRVDLAVQ